MVQEDLNEITTEFLDKKKTISSETGIFLTFKLSFN